MSPVVQGDCLSGKEAEAVTVRVTSATHPRFVRSGHDVLHKVQIPLYQALTGAAIPILGLDGHKLTVPVTDIVCEGLQLRLPGKGLPSLDGGKVQAPRSSYSSPDLVGEPQHMHLTVIQY